MIVYCAFIVFKASTINLCKKRNIAFALPYVRNGDTFSRFFNTCLDKSLKGSCALWGSLLCLKRGQSRMNISVRVCNAEKHSKNVKFS